MSDPCDETQTGFSEFGQETYGEIPTEPIAFLEWTSRLGRDHPYKYELSNGKVSRMMINVSRAHWRVSANLLGELLQKIDKTRFEAGPAEFGVKTPYGIRFPDVLVEHASQRLDEYASTSPLLIVEVLSPSTAGLDFTEKLDEYTAIASLGTYLICSQDEPRAWIWPRREDGSFSRQPEEHAGRDATIEIAALGIKLAMAAIFRGIPNSPAP